MVVIPKSVNPKRIAENFKATQLQLDAEEIKRLRGIDKNCRLFKVHSIVRVVLITHCHPLYLIIIPSVIYVPAQ